MRTEARTKLRADLFAVLEGPLLRRSRQANTAFTDTDQFRHLRPGLREIQYRSPADPLFVAGRENLVRDTPSPACTATRA